MNTDETHPTGLDTPATAAARHDGAHRGRRLSWAAFYAMRPDLRPDNDSSPNEGAAKSA